MRNIVTRIASLSLLIIIISACTFRSDSYSLLPAKNTESIDKKDYGIIGLRDITLPEYWGDRRIPMAENRHKITRSNKINLSENPKTVFYKAFKNSLTEHNANAVLSPPWPTEPRPQNRIDIHISTLIGKLGDTLVLEGYAMILGEKSRQIILRSEVDIVDDSTNSYLDAINIAIDDAVQLIYANIKPL